MVQLALDKDSRLGGTVPLLFALTLTAGLTALIPARLAYFYNILRSAIAGAVFAAASQYIQTYFELRTLMARIDTTSPSTAAYLRTVIWAGGSYFCKSDVEDSGYM